MKRGVEDDIVESQHNVKRQRLASTDRISHLTDELILRVLSYLSPSALCDCQRLSSRFRTLANDSSLWRMHYFQRFVQPRSHRLPGTKDSATGRHHFPTRASQWLDDQHLIEHGAKTDWKRQYKLRHNWSCGACDVEEIILDKGQRQQPTVVDMRDGTIFTADHEQGLRAWTTKGDNKLIGQTFFDTCSMMVPTSMSIDISNHTTCILNLCVAFEDGSFHVYSFNEENSFKLTHRQAATPEGAIAAISMAWPLAVVLTVTQRLRIYHLTSHHSPEEDSDTLRLVHSVRANKPYWPTSVSLRQTTIHLIVSIAYIEPTYFSGCTVGLQEIIFSAAGQMLTSRTASTASVSYHSIARKRHSGPSRQAVSRAISSQPVSLSYTHPYLLVSRSDRTLSLYMVTSTPQTLSISNDKTLWGHTSSVSGAHIGKRGKALSASKHGDELLIWELEGEVPFTNARDYYKESGVLAKPANGSRSPSSATSPATLSDVRVHWPSLLKDPYDGLVSDGWLGFDAENAVVLRRDNDGREVLMIYDFT